MYTHLNGIHYGVSTQYTVSIMNPAKMCVHVMRLKVLLLNGFSQSEYSEPSLEIRFCESNLTLNLLLLTVPDRKCVGFSLIFLCKSRFGFRTELGKSKTSFPPQPELKVHGNSDHAVVSFTTSSIQCAFRNLIDANKTVKGVHTYCTLHVYHEMRRFEVYINLLDK